jgi:hypothetical protein
MKRKLVIFAGKPGIGKSTLIKALFKNHTIVDVLPFVKAYEINGKVVQEKTLQAYKDMYKYIESLKDEEVVLEIGTNHPDINIANMNKLKDEYDVKLFLCEASHATNFERLQLRAGRGAYDEEMLERLGRDFPNTFVNELKKTELDYEILDMEGTPEAVQARASNSLLL